MSDLVLTGYGPSVYTRSVRLALAAHGMTYDWVETNPFDATGQAALRDLHPFGRVPVLDHNSVRLYETAAILIYLDGLAGAPAQTGLAAARAAQVISIADAYVYPVLVRQVFSHGVFRPGSGADWSPETLAEGLAAAPGILDALESLASEGHVLTGAPGRADWHLFPMIDAFAQQDDARVLLSARPALAAWHERLAG